MLKPVESEVNPFLARQAFGKLFKKTPEELDMHVIYDVSHNIAKVTFLLFSFLFYLYIVLIR